MSALASPRGESGFLGKQNCLGTKVILWCQFLRATHTMNPETHLLASWVIGAKLTDNARDCRMVALAGILPDADGLGLLVDLGRQAFGYKSAGLYVRYHHYWLHGIFG